MKSLSLGGLVAQRLEQRTHNGNLGEVNKGIASEINNIAAHRCPSLPIIPGCTTQKQRKLTDFLWAIFQSARHFETSQAERISTRWRIQREREDQQTHGDLESRRAYGDVWEQFVRVAPKYWISAVALGKVCGKLQIPLPGRGYWTRKEIGKAVDRLPLPIAKNLPAVQRFKFPPPEARSEVRHQFAGRWPPWLLRGSDRRVGLATVRQIRPWHRGREQTQSQQRKPRAQRLG